MSLIQFPIAFSLASLLAAPAFAAGLSCQILEACDAYGECAAPLASDATDATSDAALTKITLTPAQSPAMTLAWAGAQTDVHEAIGGKMRRWSGNTPEGYNISLVMKPLDGTSEAGKFIALSVYEGKVAAKATGICEAD